MPEGQLDLRFLLVRSFKPRCILPLEVCVEEIPGSWSAKRTRRPLKVLWPPLLCLSISLESRGYFSPARLNPSASIVQRGFFLRYILLCYPPIMENQMEKKMENEMETGGIWGFKVYYVILG